MEKVKTYQHFDFVVEEMTEEQAQALMLTIVSIAETLGLYVGGGYHQTSDANYPSSSPESGSAQDAQEASDGEENA